MSTKQNKNLFFFWFGDGGLFRDVDTVQELSDILVLDSSALLDSGSGLGDGLDVVSRDVEFVLHGLGDFNSDSFGHWDDSEELLAQEVSDFEAVASLDDGAVDGEMSVGGSELVSETESDTLK